MRVTILGSGSSTGTPAVDRGWGRCDPHDPRNRRTRPSILVEEGQTRLLIDTAPDLREQLLRADVRTLSAVFYTHTHADHVHGIDDLRAVNRAMQAPLDAYADRYSLDVMAKRFDYAFQPLPAETRYYYKPTLIPREMQAGETVRVGELEVAVCDQDHGFSRSLGFRFGSVAYSTDAVNLPEETFAMLAGVRTWIVGVLVDRPHPTHCDVGKALEWIDRVAPDRAILTHFGIELDHATLEERLPRGVQPAFDGMIIDSP
jgi:phosphoribosyl 1,2-cyclic phosphate phosphodiesterase